VAAKVSRPEISGKQRKFSQLFKGAFPIGNVAVRIP
jgi:hypothetical protein